MNYQESMKKALITRCKKIDGPNAYLGCYFVKDKKLWVHHLTLLLNRLGWTYNHENYLNSTKQEQIECDRQIQEILDEYGYTLADYRKYENMEKTDALKLFYSEASERILIKSLQKVARENIIATYIELGGINNQAVYLQDRIAIYADGSFTIDNDIILLDDINEDEFVYTLNTNSRMEMRISTILKNIKEEYITDIYRNLGKKSNQAIYWLKGNDIAIYVDNTRKKESFSTLSGTFIESDAVIDWNETDLIVRPI